MKTGFLRLHSLYLCSATHNTPSFTYREYIYKIFECAKFRGSSAIVGLVGLLSSCHRGTVPSWVLKFFSLVFRGSKIFSHGYFVDLKFFLWYFVGAKFFLVGISWVQNFFSWVFRESRILWFSINFSKKQKQTYDWGTLTNSFK